MRSSLKAIKWPIYTERLILRAATPADAEAIWKYRRLEEITRWLAQAPTSLDAYRAQVQEAGSANSIVVHIGSELIGDLTLDIQDGWSQEEIKGEARCVQAELGWVFKPQKSGHGYASEAVRELLRISFEVLRLRRVSAHCFAANSASWRLMERVGMRRECYTIHESLHRSGEWLDGVGYALLADEWLDSMRA